jgi:phosphoglycerate dehydrogenase-like enzyme
MITTEFELRKLSQSAKRRIPRVSGGWNGHSRGFSRHPEYWGSGAIGGELARRSAALGMHLLLWSRDMERRSLLSFAEPAQR